MDKWVNIERSPREDIETFGGTDGGSGGDFEG
jgi:hypothetical protein